MSGPPSTPSDARKQFVNALIWAVLAAGLAVVLFLQAARPDNEKKNFYIVAGVIAIIAALVNGYAAWNAHRQSKTPGA